MPKLQTLNTSLSTLRSPLADPLTTAGNVDRLQGEPWRKWYNTKRWQELRMQVLVRDHFTCQWRGHGLMTGRTSDLVAHHKVPHRGSAVLFWDINNLLCVCRWCHDGPIKALERAEAQGGLLP